MRLPRPFWLPLAATLFTVACDPKLTGTGDGNGGDDDDLPAPTVTSEAAVVGTILALHVDIFRAGLSVSTDFDSSAVATRFGRGFLEDGCWSLTEASVAPPQWDLSLEGCTDGRGTTYRGGGEFDPVDALDGYAFFPWYDTDLIRALNDADDDFNHDLHSGSIEFGFGRSSGAVNAVNVAKFLRHNVRSEIVTFTYDGTTFSGTHGSFSENPDGVARVVWDSVGVIEVEWQGSNAQFVMQGVLYSADLATGDVTAVSRV